MTTRYYPWRTCQLANKPENLHCLLLQLCSPPNTPAQASLFFFGAFYHLLEEQRIVWEYSRLRIRRKTESCSVMSNSVTPWTVAHQTPLSMEFSRQEYWSGLPFPSPGNLPNSGIEPRSLTSQADSLLSK